MHFSTKITIPQSRFPIDYDCKIILLGSCFAENMGEKFNYFKLQTTVNPFGIIFNPVSIAKIIERSVRKNYFKETDVFYHNELWQSFEVHSEHSNIDKNSFLISLNELIDATHQQLTEATHLFITLGTSWVYRNIETNNIVANCHKVAQNQFTKELLKSTEIENSITTLIALVKSINSRCTFTVTVSPVRHIKDGFVENTVSKAHLIAALHQITNQHPTLTYFPAYEIMMDELRDYRFYSEDMLHPNATAVDYIWELFCKSFVAVPAVQTMSAIDAIQKGLAHKPFNPNSDVHQKFETHLKTKIEAIQKAFPHISFP